MIKLLVFDLDGTLINTLGDLGNSVNYALTKRGTPPLSRSAIQKNIGDGAQKLIERSLKASKRGESSTETEINGVLDLFLEHYHHNCVIESACYPGVVASLERLKGYRKAVLTNKPFEPAQRILEKLGLAQHFDWVIGGDNPFGSKPNPAALNNLLVSAHAKPHQAIMIGDGIQDLQVARLGGTHFLGFLGGLGNRQALLAQQPEAILEDMTFLPESLSLLEARPESHAGNANSMSQGKA